MTRTTTKKLCWMLSATVIGVTAATTAEKPGKVTSTPKAAQGLRIAFLPTWGKYVARSAFDGKVDGIFNVTNALACGRFLGQRYRDRGNVICILGGNKAPSTPQAVAIWPAMTRGIAEEGGGREDYSKVLMRSTLRFAN